MNARSLSLLCGVLTVVTVRIFGTVYAAQGVLAITSLSWFASGRQSPPKVRLVAAASFFLLAWILVDPRGKFSARLDWGGTVALMAATALGVMHYGRTTHHFTAIALGVSAGLYLRALGGATEIGWLSAHSLGERVVFGAAPTLLFLCAWCNSNVVLFWVLGLGALGSCFVAGDRGGSLAILVGLVGCGAARMSSRGARRGRKLLASWPGTAIAASGAAALTFYVLLGLALLDLPNAQHASKFLRQASHPYGLVIGARPDFLAMIVAGGQSPIFGFGADGLPRDLERELARINAELATESALEQERRVDRGVVLHSGLLGGWVRFGVAGLLFWSVILAYAINALRTSLLTDDPEKALVLGYCATALIFTVLFEPGRMHLVIGVYAGICVGLPTFSRSERGGATARNYLPMRSVRAVSGESLVSVSSTGRNGKGSTN